MLNLKDFLSFIIGNSTLYHLCGDNIDFTVKQRYMRIGNSKPDPIHYFHLFAVADRIDCSNLPDQIIATQQTDPSQIAASLLPTPEDDIALRDNICGLMSRILCDHVEFFKMSFEDVVEKHIKHEYYEEMSMKSIVVSVIKSLHANWRMVLLNSITNFF